MKLKTLYYFNKVDMDKFFTLALLFFMQQLLCTAQSVNFKYSPNMNIVKKVVDIDKKVFGINGDSLISILR